jgi:polyisoprenoid-binding protein YceI
VILISRPERQYTLKQSSPKLLLKLSLSVVAAFLAAFAQAQAPKVSVHLDPAATEIHWTLNGNTHTTHGTFKLKGGVVNFDPATGVADGELLVDLTTGASGNQDRDARMQTEVLQSDKYPEAFFHPTKISGSLKAGATQTLTAEGSFNIHGADHPLTLQIEVKLDGDQATATTHFAIPYVAWGMKDPGNMLLRVGKEVDIDLVARATVAQPQAAQK